MEDTKDKAVELTADERVQLLFDKLQAKKAEVAKAERPQYITGGQFRFSESAAASFDITTERNVRKLRDALSFLIRSSKDCAEANEILGLTENFTWLGFTVEEWIKDLKTRVDVLQIAKRKQELAELEARVDKVLSPELRRKMELDALEAALEG